MYSYSDHFYQYINRGSSVSAAVVVPHLLELLPDYIHSVLDMGCGVGAWLQEWKRHQIGVLGVDGPYIDAESLLIEPHEFVAHDITAGLGLERQFDLVQCLEVAEHLPESSAGQLVASLCSHADLVLFSAAVPGQGGEHHINERSYEYWREHFFSQGFIPCDVLRPALAGNQRVEPWYRYNTLLYIRSTKEPGMPAAVRRAMVPRSEKIADVSPVSYRMRKAVIRLLPKSIVTKLAVANRRWVNWRRPEQCS